MFQTASIAKYAYVYMAQPLKEGTPSVCLGCIGTDNTFTAQEVLQRCYMHNETAKRGVRISSFSAEGDSRCLHAMLLYHYLQQWLPNSNQALTNIYRVLKFQSL